jgi:hypothetical protein
MSYLIPVAGPLASPHAQLVSGCDTAVDTECEVGNLTAFTEPGEGKVGVVVFCVDEFRSKNPADYEVLTYTAKNAGTDELEGLVSRVGTPRSWPAGTYAASYGTGWAWDQVWAAIIALVGDISDHTSNTTTAHGAVSTATASKLLIRDANGRAKVASSSDGTDIALVSQTSDKLPLAGGTMTGPIDFNGQKAQKVIIEDYAETLSTGTWDSATQTLDLSTANNHYRDITAAVTSLSFTNPRAGAHSFTLILAQGATLRAVTWPVSIAWAGGFAPSMAINKTYWITFVTLNGGTTWTGFLAGVV